MGACPGSRPGPFKAGLRGEAPHKLHPLEGSGGRAEPSFTGNQGGLGGGRNLSPREFMGGNGGCEALHHAIGAMREGEGIHFEICCIGVMVLDLCCVCVLMIVIMCSCAVDVCLY